MASEAVDSLRRGQQGLQEVVAVGLEGDPDGPDDPVLVVDVVGQVVAVAVVVADVRIIVSGVSTFCRRRRC